MNKEQATNIVTDLAKKIIDELKPARLVIGLSGGADSTLALLVCCKVRELKPDCFVQAVHCIHGLDADDPIWLAHCKKLCARVDVALVTPKLHIVYGNGRSPEEVSRAERYNALLENLKGGVLVLGHQADDEAESFLLALKRGSGPHGLSGMHFLTCDERGVIVRPLLELTKAKIEEILVALDFDFVYDISNSYLKFERNFIRLKVLPLLKTRFKGIESAILRSQKLCAQEHDLASRFVQPIFKTSFDGSDPLCLKLNFQNLDLNDEHLMLFLLREFVLQKATMPPELNALQSMLDLMRSSDDQKGIVKIEDFEVRRFRKNLYLLKMPIFPQAQRYILKQGEILKAGDFAYSLSEHAPNEVILDFKLKGSEKIKPKTRSHSRELKKLLAEYEVPYFLRSCQCLIRDSQDIILGVGDLFICDCAKLNEIEPLVKIQRIC